MFGLIKKTFFAGLTFLSYVNLLTAAPLNAIPLTATQLSATPLKCVSMTNQECKVRPEIVNFNSDGLYFILLMLKQANALVAVKISMIHMQKCVFLML